MQKDLYSGSLLTQLYIKVQETTKLAIDTKKIIYKIFNYMLLSSSYNFNNLANTFI